MSNKVIGSTIVIAIVIIGLFILLGMCSVKVPAGYVAIQYDMNGGVRNEVLKQGFHFISPTVSTTKYTIGIEQSYLTASNKGDSPDDDSFTASSVEGKAIKIDLTYTYQYDVKKVHNVFSKFKGQSGTEVRDSFIKPNIISWTKEVVSKYKVSDIIGEKRSDINSALTNYISDKFKDYGIIVDNVSLIDVSVDKNTQKAINEKIKAQQNAETQAINNNTNIEKAKADADVKLKQAQAEADATKIKAEAQAEANKKLSQSITKELIENNKISKWNGQMPTYMSNGKDSLIISE